MEKINAILNDFQALTLTELNASASFLKRIDRKFILPVDDLLKILEKLQNKFQILEIGGHKVFSYDNIYMDNEDYLFYNQHEAWEDKRSKVRTRLYKEANMAFFEFKQKEAGITSKYRYEFPTEEHGEMTKGKKRFFEWVWQSMYNGDPKAPKLTPSLNTRYKRITLVDRILWERVTIDLNISTKDLRDSDGKRIKLKDVAIIESKSLDDECYTVNLLKKFGYEQAHPCSKYAIGLINAKKVKSKTSFENTLKKIKKITK